MKIEVVDVQEHPEDGSATYTFDVDDGSRKALADLGLKFLLYCAAADVSTEDALGMVVREGNTTEEYCLVCGGPKSNHPYRHPFEGRSNK